MKFFRRKGTSLGQKTTFANPHTMGRGKEESPEVSALNYKCTQHPNSDVSAINDVSIKVAGRLKYFLSAWKLITNRKILDMVQHCHQKIVEPLSQHYNLPPTRFSPEEAKIIDDEAKTLLQKGVISNIFLRKKKNGRYRVILNPKRLSESIEYQNFKMGSLSFTVQLMRKIVTWPQST